MEKLPLLNYDSNPNAVITPTHDKLDYNFPEKLLYFFATEEKVNKFLQNYPHKIIGEFKTISFSPNIYQIEYQNQFFTVAQAPLGAPAATQFLDWLIAYGVKRVLAIGSCGVLVDIPENTLLLPVKALRDEGTSLHYLPASRYIDLKTSYLSKIKNQIIKLNLRIDEVKTWTTDGYFRETSNKVKQYRNEGICTVEMECSAIAACCQFRSVEFAQILYTADTLFDVENYDNRNWGRDVIDRVMNLALKISAES